MEPCEADSLVYSAVERLLHKRKYLKECKLKISQFSSAILQDTNENVGRLRDLLRMATDPLFLKSRQLCQLLLASLCVVFKDVLPTYKIRPPSEEELQQKVKKETKRLWQFEDILLKNYEKYVLLLQTILKDKGRKRLPKSLRVYDGHGWGKAERLGALKCACSLFENNPQFNFGSDLLRCIMPYLQKPQASVRKIVLSCMQSIFYADLSGEATLMVCRGVHKFARIVNYRIRPDVANAIAGISIKEIADPSIAGKTNRNNRKLASRKERKQDKVLAKFNKDQAESKASKSHEERLRLNSEILKEILFVYFKVLKTTKDSDLLSAVLAGLSTYAHIINVDYVENLLQLMNAFVINPKTRTQDGLHCVHTALSILNSSSASSLLNIDPTRFSNHLYTLLGRMAGVSTGQAVNSAALGKPSSLMQYKWAQTPASLAAQTLAMREELLNGSRKGDSDMGESTTASGHSKGSGMPLNETERFTDVILACLDMLIVSRKREVSTTRVLAFVKRLASLSVAVSDTPCQAAMLISLWKFVSLFPKCEVLFDSDTEIGGVYSAEALDPELARPASAVLWELHVLRRHASPLIRKIVTVILRWARQMTKTGTPRPSDEVLATPDYTLESLSMVHPAERRILLARSEAVCLSTPTTGCGTTSKGRYQPSPWLRYVVSTMDHLQMGGALTSIKAVIEETND